MTWNPKPETVAVIDAARDVIADAADDGYRFTLRRVFYALVSANQLPNTERAYKNLSATLDRARWEGLIPLHSLDDLGRSASVWESWPDAADFADEMARRYRSDWWLDADPTVEVWAEKQAVASIVEPVAATYGVPFMAAAGSARSPRSPRPPTGSTTGLRWCCTSATTTRAAWRWTATFKTEWTGSGLTSNLSGWR